MVSLRSTFDKYQKKLASISGQTVNILRPNYSTIVNTNTTVYTSIKLKMEVTTPKLVQGKFTNVEYYAVFGDRNKFQPGDIIVPTESTSSTPPVTVLHYSPLEEAIGFRTSRIGKITQSYVSPYDPVYENVYFDWVGTGYPGSIFGQELAGALGTPTKKIVLYTRTNIKPQSNTDEVQGMRFVESDGTTEIRWVIKLVDQIGNITQLTLEPDGQYGDR